jgi:hypothetical protein
MVCALSLTRISHRPNDAVYHLCAPHDWAHVSRMPTVREFRLFLPPSAPSPLGLCPDLTPSTMGICGGMIGHMRVEIVRS